MMQSVPVLILVLCCMASAHRAIHDLDIRHIHVEAKQDCGSGFPPDDYPKNCLAYYNAFNDIDTAILEGFCKDQDCIVPLNDYYKCALGFDSYSDYLCARHNNEYCLVTYNYMTDACNYCTYSGTCTDTCRSCLSRYVDDLSCCFDQYRGSVPDYYLAYDQDVCGNTYDTCSTSGSAIAVPTILTALLVLLMVMAAIVM